MPTAPVYPLGIGITPDGRRLYGCGGISNGSNKIIGYDIAADGTLSAIAGAPFTSPGNSPAYCAFSADSAILFIGHGSDATVRSFTLDDAGVPTSTGASFDVGLQGSIGDIAVLAGQLLITDDTSATDGIAGLYSFDIQPDGIFTSNGPAISSQARLRPTEIAVWLPPVNCRASRWRPQIDLDGPKPRLSELRTMRPGTQDFLPRRACFDHDGCITLSLI